MLPRASHLLNRSWRLPDLVWTPLNLAKSLSKKQLLLLLAWGLACREGNLVSTGIERSTRSVTEPTGASGKLPRLSHLG